MGFGLVRYSARASITLNQLAEQGSGLNQRGGEENRDRDKRGLVDIGRRQCQPIKGG